LWSCWTPTRQLGGQQAGRCQQQQQRWQRRPQQPKHQTQRWAQTSSLMSLMLPLAMLARKVLQRQH
jgi:hypothetical protein